MIYTMSDIHGCIDAFDEALASVDLSDGTSRLVLLGDYIDRGPASLRVIRRAMELQQRYPGQVIALRGNHEEMFLEYLDGVLGEESARAWMLSDSNLATTASFLADDEFAHVKHLLRLRDFDGAYQYSIDAMRRNHPDAIAWVRGLPYFYESGEGQVFVHAGIEEEAGDWWKVGTPDEYFTSMMPDYVGKRFYLDVIAGHVSTETVSRIPGYQGIWHDGASHYYIDGNVMKNGRVAVLRYDERTQRYSGEGLDEDA